jgi:hypothetical protein
MTVNREMYSSTKPILYCIIIRPREMIIKIIKVVRTMYDDIDNNGLLHVGPDDETHLLLLFVLLNTPTLTLQRARSTAIQFRFLIYI